MQYVLVTGSKEIRGHRAELKGWAIRATSAAVVNIRDGGASGNIVVPLNIANGVSTHEKTDIFFDNDIYVEVVSGTIVGSVFVE